MKKLVVVILVILVVFVVAFVVVAIWPNFSPRPSSVPESEISLGLQEYIESDSADGDNWDKLAVLALSNHNAFTEAIVDLYTSGDVFSLNESKKRGIIHAVAESGARSKINKKTFRFILKLREIDPEDEDFYIDTAILHLTRAWQNCGGGFLGPPPWWNDYVCSPLRGKKKADRLHRGFIGEFDEKVDAALLEELPQ